MTLIEVFKNYKVTLSPKTKVYSIIILSSIEMCFICVTILKVIISFHPYMYRFL